MAAVIITGAGEKAFTAGVDLKEMETAPLTPEELGPDSTVNRAFRALGKPTIAAVNGFAITGGMELAINCDILVASTNARFADTHARVGIVPGWGMSQILPRLIGPVRARYMSYTGNFVDAATAKAWGLVLEVLPPG
ncbi:Enoyl-CoA hydratase, partial [sediment metagenome]